MALDRHPTYDHGIVKAAVDAWDQGPVVLIPVIDADDNAVVYMEQYGGSEHFKHLCINNPFEAAIACCKRAYTDARKHDLRPAVR